MNNDELSDYIVRYATTDITKTAILLSGKWGSGKSYFISHDLCKKLKEKNVKHVVVSLYGVDSLKELSKQLYCSLRLPNLSKKSETKEGISIVTRTIINNALSFKGISLDVSEDKLQKLYDSVNLQDVLVVLEDIERSSINILKLLGFINGLVEYDGAKVLLVANEEELIEKERLLYSNSNSLSEDADDLQIQVLEYKRIKEKTIGDTIKFNNDIVDAISSILSNHPSVLSKALFEPQELERIANLVVSYCDCNLRMFIYALQKCNEIFAIKMCKSTFEDSFYQASFEGMLIISKDFMRSNIPLWNQTRNISSQLGDDMSPVFKFVYDYLKWHTIDERTVIATSEEYKKYLFFEESSRQEKDDDLGVIRGFYKQKDQDVLNALANIEKKLKKTNYGGISIYEDLAFYVLKAGSVVGYDTEKILSLMIKNVKAMCKKGEPVLCYVKLPIADKNFDNRDIVEKYNDFLTQLAQIVEKGDDYSFSYNPDEFFNHCIKYRQQFSNQHRFISCFDVDRLAKMLLKSTANQIDSFITTLFSFYRNASNTDYDIQDVETLIQLNAQLKKTLLQKNKEKIRGMQIKDLLSNIDMFIKNMSDSGDD